MDVVHLVKDRKTGCPFGHCCDDCNLYRPMYRKLVTGGSMQEFDCTLNNLVKLQDETKDRLLGVQQATEEARNRTAEVLGEVRRQSQHMVIKEALTQQRMKAIAVPIEETS